MGPVIQDWTRSRRWRVWQIRKDLGDGPSPGAAHFPPVGLSPGGELLQDVPTMELPLNSDPLSSLGRERPARPSWPRRSAGEDGDKVRIWRSPHPVFEPCMAQLSQRLQVGAGRGSF